MEFLNSYYSKVLSRARHEKNIFSLRPFSAIAFCAYLLAPSFALAIGFDRFDNLNGVEDAAADVWQGADNTSGQRPGLTLDTGTGLCQNMNLGGTEGQTEGSLALGTRCLELVESADPGTVDPNLNLGGSPGDVPGWLQQIVPEETEIIGAGATDTAHNQTINVDDRLHVLRTGASTLSIPGFHFTGDSKTGGAAGADGFSRLGFFLNGDYGSGDKDATFNESGFGYDTYGVTAGVDYRFIDGFFAGIALGYSNSEVDVDRNAGKYDSDGMSVTTYGMYHREPFYIEGSLTYASYEHDGERKIEYGAGQSRIERTATSSTDSEHLVWSVGAGYGDNINNFIYDVFIRAEGMDTEIDAYDEDGTGNSAAIGNNEWTMHIDKQELDSLQAVLGTQFSIAFSQSFGVIQPHFGVEWHYEFEDKARTVTAFYRNDPFFAAGDKRFPVQLITDPSDENFFMTSLGSSFVFKGGTQVFVNYQTVLALDDVNSHGLTLGARFEF